MIRSELRTHTYRKLAEVLEVQTESFWHPDTIDDFLNRSYEQVCVQAELLQCTSLGSVTFVSGEVHGEYAFPRDTLRVIRVFYRGKRLKDTTIDELDLLDPEWTEKAADPASQPTHWAPRGQVFHLYPAPSETATDVLRLWCIQTPAPLTTDGQEPEIPTGYHEAIAIGAAIRALKSDRTGPENPRAVALLERDYAAAIGWAQAQHLRKGPSAPALRDVRDFYATTSGWRA